DKFSIVQITSCDEHQDLVTNEYAWDTYLYVYSDCAGTLLAENDDMEANCVYNRASSWATIVMNAGETAYIFWPLKFPTAAHAYEEFYWNINVTYPIDGDVCENAIPLTLPVVNHFGTTVGFNDDYDASPCSPYSNYMDGNDKVYTITLPEEGYLIGNILGAYGSIHVLDICPTVELEKFHCKAYVGGPNGGQFRKKIAAGTYFVIISTWSPPQTVDYLLNMSFESASGVDNGDLANTLSVYPNPTNGKFTVSISNNEATDMTIELVNISGQVVYRNDVKAAYSYNEDIDASSFAKGVYYLKVNDGKDVKVEKVVLQ
ncbi:MAG: T9SS type A sorting domain-containing protein, partial [Bacteroidales bacterium]|nr:T9SS type A sorting domain-containing protein [Bacteroidales bacterium]